VKNASDISAHYLGLVRNYMAAGAHAADSTGSSFTPVPPLGDNIQGPAFPFYWVTAVDVESASNTGTVVALGDSITDGYCSNRTSSNDVLPDVYNRWTDLLAARFAALPADQAKAVVDEGISGNTVVSAGGAGLPALVRMNNDVLSREGVTHVILFEGTNDIAAGATAATVIAADEQIIERAHAAGLTIIGATIIPRGDASQWSSTKEQQRVALNDWIRHQAHFDGVIDFDSLMQGPVNNPKTGAATINPQWRCGTGDGVHPNSAGYAAMSSFIDLSLFSKMANR